MKTENYSEAHHLKFLEDFIIYYNFYNIFWQDKLTSLILIFLFGYYSPFVTFHFISFLILLRKSDFCSSSLFLNFANFFMHSKKKRTQAEDEKEW